MVTHHFTVDVEEYFHVSALEPWVDRSRWSEFESRIEGSLLPLLDHMDRAGARGTFFVLGWLADRKPGLVREIAARGHEVASHGWAHRRVTELRPEEFRRSVRLTKALLEDITGAPVVGYRAPSFSVVPGTEWALDVLVEEGYRYDSSIYPVRRPGYGYPGAGRDPFRISRGAGHIIEVPPATLRRLGVTLPAGGGAYFRHFPYGLIERALEDCEDRATAGTFYIHPWELDPDQPRLDVPWLTRLRHYGGLELTRERLERLLEDFHFGSVADGLPALSRVYATERRGSASARSRRCRPASATSGSGR